MTDGISKSRNATTAANRLAASEYEFTRREALAEERRRRDEMRERSKRRLKAQEKGRQS